MRSVLLLLLVACGEPDDTGDPPGPVTVDEDRDGFPAREDCDDQDPLVHPGLSDPCDGLDNDCDGATDEEPDLTWYTDSDGDGFGTGDASAPSCLAPAAAMAANGVDCDDGDAQVYPGRLEECDGRDQDCDGAVDNGIGVFADMTATGGDGSEAAPFPSIQAALDSGGTCILVAPGYYSENLTFPPWDVSLRSLQGSGDTVVAGRGDAPVVTLESGSTTATLIQGLTITGGNADYGGGIRVYYAGVTLRDLLIYGNTASYGAGLQAQGADLVVEDLRIQGNKAYNAGGGLELVSSTLVATRLQVESNSAGMYGGGAFVYSGSGLFLEDSLFADNTASSAGTAYVYYSSSVEAVHSVFRDNTGSLSPGFDITQASSASFKNCVFNANIASNRSGSSAVDVRNGSSATLVNTTIVGSEALAALYVWSGATLTLRNSIVAFNGGYGLLVVDSTGADLSYNDFWENSDGPISDPTGALLSSSWFEEDPSFVSFVDDFSGAGDDLHLSEGSRLLDAGDPDPAWQDPDGSPNQVGAYGGPLGGW